VPKVILKLFGVDIPILCTSENNVEIRKKKNIFSTFTAVEITFHFLALMFKCPLSPGLSKN
jgi:hypothetical protein